MPKEKQTQMTDDEIREILLEYLYNSWYNSRGMEGVRQKLTDIEGGVKRKYPDLKRQEIVRNLYFLSELGWVHIDKEEKTFRTERASYPSTSVYFRISAEGITRYEGKSKFQKIQNPYIGINLNEVKGITAINIGDGHQIVVSSDYKPLYEVLVDLEKAIQESKEISNEQKLTIVSNIETIKAQLSNQTPDKSIIRKVWENIELALSSAIGIEWLAKKVEFIRSIIEKLL